MIQGRSCLSSVSGITPFKPALQIKRELGLSTLDRMGANENPLGPSPKAIAAMVAAAQEAHYYPDAGSWELRRALADRIGWPVEGIVVEAGITGLLRVSVEAFCEPGDRVVYPWPSYANYPLTLLPLGATPVPVQGKGLEPDWEGIAREAQTAKMVWLCNPNNPTGLQYGNDQIRWLLERVPEGCLVMVDEAYHEFGDQASALELLREGFPSGGNLLRGSNRSLLGGCPPIVVLRTFAKAYGLAGLRVGYGVMPPAVADWFNRAREPFQVSSIAQAAALAALDDQEHLDKSIQVVREGRAFLAAECAKLGITVVPSAANFLLLHIGTDCRPLAGALLKQGIMVRATDDIFALPGYLRVTVGTRAMNERFIAALAALRG
jgi:histidinol-phosphate aminotransferase